MKDLTLTINGAGFDSEKQISFIEQRGMVHITMHNKTKKYKIKVSKEEFNKVIDFFKETNFFK